VALPASQTELAVAALVQAGCRGVVVDDGHLPGGLALPSGVIRVDNVPQAWLCPRLAAFVHAGQAATTAAALRAGVPSLVMSTGRAGAWGRLLAARGLGILVRRGTSAPQLAGHLRAMLADADLHRRLTALSDPLGAEDGVAGAVAIITEAVR
jgi:sterol 3beta-glucosyltransferase